jgi:predicted ATPase
MRVKSLSLTNIGPFREANLDMTLDGSAPSPVVLITGENGAGKSIILDAIRAMFGDQYATLERDIRRREARDRAEIKMVLSVGHDEVTLAAKKFQIHRGRSSILPEPLTIRALPYEVRDAKAEAPDWVVDYWPSGQATGRYDVNQLLAPKHREFLVQALQGQREKQDVTQLICHLDYLRDSKDASEQAVGQRLYGLLERIIADSLLSGGYLSHVARATYEPIVVQNGQSVGLTNLSGGNSYLSQNMVALLRKMYSAHFLREAPLSELGKTPGLLLIDEAENQLHPKWQKRLLDNILKVFPNLQIVATTHSPFIIASARQAQLFVCKAKRDHCVVVDATAQYSNRPVDEILMSPLFEATRPFNAEITQLLEEREAAIQSEDSERRAQIEKELKEINPTYFSYLDIDKMLEDLTDGEQPA